MEKIDFSDQIKFSFDASHEGHVYRSVIEAAERVLIEKALFKSRGNQILAARFLGLNRNTLRTKIKYFNIGLEQFKS